MSAAAPAAGRPSWQSIAKAAALACLVLGGPDGLSQEPPRSAPFPSAPKPASEPERGPRWTSLSPAQREALAPLQKDWAGIDAGRKQKWLEVAARMPAMTAEERERVRERMAEWARMTPAQRGQARLNFQESRTLAAEDRQARWEAYKALPESERKALAAKAKEAATPESPDTGTKAVGPKRNTVPDPTAAPTSSKPVAPTVVQARPGASTTLVTRTSSPPLHQQPGLPKIVASEDRVDPLTLLPRRPVQAPATAASAPAAVATDPAGTASAPSSARQP